MRTVRLAKYTQVEGHRGDQAGTSDSREKRSVGTLRPSLRPLPHCLGNCGGLVTIYRVWGDGPATSKNNVRDSAPRGGAAGPAGAAGVRQALAEEDRAAVLTRWHEERFVDLPSLLVGPRSVSNSN
jgi:hypothetical protein